MTQFNAQVFPQAWIFFLVFFVLCSVGIMELTNAIFIDSLMTEKNKIEMEKKKQQASTTTPTTL